MRTIKILSALISFYLGSYSFQLFAQDSLNVDSSVWNLQKCLDYAKKNNIQLNSLRLDQQTSQQEYLLSRAALLPGLSGTASQTLNRGKSLNTNTGQFQSGVTPLGSYGLNSSVLLYQGGYLKSDIQVKNLAVQSANLSVVEQENTISLNIMQYYLNVLLDKESIIYQQQIVSTSTAQVAQANQRYTAGSIARKDLAQLQSQLANDKYTLTTAENTKRQDLLTLKQVLQLPTSSAFDIANPDTIVSQKAITNLYRVQAKALATRPEIEISELGIQSAKLNLYKARSGYKPTLTATGYVGSSYSGTTPGYFNQLNNYFNQQVGLSLSVPIFNKRVNKTNVAEAKINIEQSQLTLKDTKTSLSQTVERAYISALNAQSQYAAAEEALRYNKETYKIANQQLQLGATAMVDFLQQKALYIQALQAFIQAKYNAALSIKIYNFYNGEPVKL